MLSVALRCLRDKVESCAGSSAPGKSRTPTPREALLLSEPVLVETASVRGLPAWLSRATTYLTHPAGWHMILANAKASAIREANVEFGEFLDVILCDSPGLAVFLHAYFDESQRQGGTFTVSGYAFLPAQARRFDRSWRRMLGDYEVFRTADLNSGKGNFEGISKEQKSSMIREAVRIVNARFYVGVAISCDLNQFRELCPKGLKYHQDPYAFLCNCCISELSKMIAPGNNVAYVFEAGHKSQGAANELMKAVHGSSLFKKRFHYKSHSFIDKEGATQLQAADLLAWEYGKFIDEKGANPMRKSLEALIGHPPERLRCKHFLRRHLVHWFDVAKANDLYSGLF
jgi:hypothetical protein